VLTTPKVARYFRQGFRYSGLNEAGRICGGCAVYVISIARRRWMSAATVLSVDFAARRGGSGSEIGEHRARFGKVP